MRILFLTPYIPFPPKFGGAVRIYNLIRQLSLRHEIVLLSYQEADGGGDADGLRPLARDIVLVPRRTEGKRRRQLASLMQGRSFQMQDHWSADMQDAIDRVTAKHRIELIIVEFAQMAGFHFPPGVPLVIDEHNVEHDLVQRMADEAPRGSFRRFFNRREAIKLKHAELAQVKRADLTLVTSARDETLLKQLVPGIRTAVITNGVDLEFFRPPSPPLRTPCTAVFIGAMHYFPNEDGIHFFMREAFPKIIRACPQFKFSIVGGVPPVQVRQYASDHVVVTGFVDDVRPYMHEASVFVVPLRMGGGTRFKVVEAMAAGIPVVSTTLGAEGIPATDGRELLYADSGSDLADAVLKLFDNPGLGQDLSRAGGEFVAQHFDWKIVGGELESALSPFAGRAAVP